MTLSHELEIRLRADLGDKEFERLHFESVAPQIYNALNMARVRCMPFTDLVWNLRELERTQNAAQIVDCLCQLSLTKEEQSLLAPALKSLLERAETFPSKSKAQIDRYASRILKRLDAEFAEDIAGPFFTHTRKARRQMAFDAFKKAGVTPSLGCHLWVLYQEHGDQEYLQLIARNPDALLRLPIERILEELDEEYWRARVIQALLEANSELALVSEIALAYPIEFVHAVGRTRNDCFLPLLLDIFSTNKTKIDFLSIFTWCLGALKAETYLDMVEEALDEISKTLQKVSI